MPSRDRVFSRTQRMERSSSTIQTGFIFCWLILSLEWPEQKQNSGLFDRQAQREDCVAGVARTIDGAVMVLDEILGDGQPQSTTALAPGNQRIEHPLADFIGNARAVVDDLDFHGQAITLLGQRHLAQRPGPENDLTLAVHCLRRVPGNVQHRLDQLLTVANQLRQAGVVVATNLQGTGKLRPQQAAHPLEDFVDIDRRRQHRPMRRQQPLHQILQAVGLLDDDLGVFLERRVGQFVLQQLRCAADAAQRILDLVRQVADQFAAGLLLFDQPFLAGRRQMVLDGLQFEQQPHTGRNIRTQRGHRAVDVQDFAVAAPQLDVLPGVAPVVVQAVVQRPLQGCRAGADRPQGLADHRTTAYRQQVFACRIDVADDLTFVDQEYGRGQEIEAGKGSMGNVHYHAALTFAAPPRPAPMPKISSILPPLLLAGGALLGGCRGGDAPPPPTPVVLVQPAAGAPAAGAVYTGEIRARHEVDLAFRVGGKIAARLVDAGAEIKPGQPLARLDPADLQLAAGSARAQLAGAESELATARAERERYAGLLAKKFVSQAAFDAKDNAFNSAQARLEQARAQSRISTNQSDYGTLSSDRAGIVTAILAEAGQVVAAGQPVLRVARPEEKEVAIAVPESRLADVRTAKGFTVDLWADPTTALRGELRELSPATDPATRTYAARIRLPQAPESLRLGMTARVTLAGEGTSAVKVPLSAVVHLGKQAQVWVVANGKLAARPVRDLRFVEEGPLIGQGLQAGEQVVVTGSASLVADQAVTPQ